MPKTDYLPHIDPFPPRNAEFLAHLHLLDSNLSAPGRKILWLKNRPTRQPLARSPRRGIPTSGMKNVGFFPWWAHHRRLVAQRKRLPGRGHGRDCPPLRRTGFRCVAASLSEQRGWKGGGVRTVRHRLSGRLVRLLACVRWATDGVCGP